MYSDGPPGGPAADPTPEQQEIPEKTEKKTASKKKSMEQAGAGKRRPSGKEAGVFRTSSSASLTNQSVKARKESNGPKLVKTTSSVNVTNKNKTPRKASKEVPDPAQKVKLTSRKSSEVSGSRKASNATVKRSPSTASTASVKSRENTFVKTVSIGQLDMPDIGGDSPSTGAGEEDGAGQNDR